MSKTNHEKL